MIEVSNIWNGKQYEQVMLSLKISQNTITRGNSLKLETARVHYDSRKYFFTDTIVCVWNSLPDNIFIASSVSNLKNRATLQRVENAIVHLILDLSIRDQMTLSLP